MTKSTAQIMKNAHLHCAAERLPKKKGAQSAERAQKLIKPGLVIHLGNSHIFVCMKIGYVEFLKSWVTLKHLCSLPLLPFWTIPLFKFQFIVTKKHDLCFSISFHIFIFSVFFIRCLNFVPDSESKKLFDVCNHNPPLFHQNKIWSKL